MYLISVYFDDKTNKILQRHIDKVAALTGNSFMTEHRVPPHLTISSIEARSEQVLLPFFRELEGQLTGGKLPIVATGQLMPYVFCLMPVLNDYLQDLSRQVYDKFSQVPETTVSRYYRAGSWLPHITIGKTLSQEQMQQAFSYMQQSFQPLEAEIVAIGLAKVNPHKDVIRFDLRR